MKGRPEPLWIDTDRRGLILDWNPEALSLVGYTAKRVAGRELPIMFANDRPHIDQFNRAMLGHPVEREGIIRPREQRGVAVRYRIELAPDSSDSWPVLRWTFERR